MPPQLQLERALGADKDVAAVLSDINTLKVDVAYPFLLELYDDYVTGIIGRQELIAVLRLVESYVFRRAVCGIPTNSLNTLVSRNLVGFFLVTRLFLRFGLCRLPAVGGNALGQVVGDGFFFANWVRQGHCLRKWRLCQTAA